MLRTSEDILPSAPDILKHAHPPERSRGVGEYTRGKEVSTTQKGPPRKNSKHIQSSDRECGKEVSTCTDGRAERGRWPSEARPVKPSDSEACQTLQEPPECAKRISNARSASRMREAHPECAKRIQNARSASRMRERSKHIGKEVSTCNANPPHMCSLFASADLFFFLFP